MREIEQGAGDQVDGGQAGSCRQLADDDVVGREVERRDNDPVGDGLGDRLPDAKPGQDRGQGVRLRLLRRSRLALPARSRTGGGLGGRQSDDLSVGTVLSNGYPDVAATRGVRPPGSCCSGLEKQFTIFPARVSPTALCP